MSYHASTQVSGNGRLWVPLHGTGGRETDLIPLAQRLDPEAGWIAPRGDVNEHGALRFFRRLDEGVFDLPDLHARTQALADFLVQAKPQGTKETVAIGFSNGANIAASILLQRSEVFDAAILLRPMTPFIPEALPDLKGKRILMLNGEMDPIVPPPNAEQLAELFHKAGAEVKHVWLQTGHNLVPGDLEAAQEWLSS